MSDLAYIAGLVDGEGWIGIRTHNKSKTYSPGLSINMTRIEGVSLCAEVLGGKILERDVTKYNERARNIYCWEISGQLCLEALRQLQPLLRVKKHQADLILSHSWEKYTRRVNIPEEIRELRKGLFLEMKQLNTVGKELRAV